MNKPVCLVPKLYREENHTHPENSGPRDCRCFCGSLIAKVTPFGVEIKCRKCKQLLLIPKLVFDRSEDKEPRSLQPISA